MTRRITAVFSFFFFSFALETDTYTDSKESEKTKESERERDLIAEISLVVTGRWKNTRLVGAVWWRISEWKKKKKGKSIHETHSRKKKKD